MSLFERVRGWLRGASEPPAAAPPAAAAQPPTEPPVAEEPSVGARAPEEISARTLATAKDDRVALAAYEALVASLGEASAIAEARRALASASLPALRVRLARALDARGDDEAVEALLSRMPESTSGPGVTPAPEPLLLEAWARRAEVAERRNDRAAARALWERVLARDVSYPRARERLARLRGDTAPRALGDAGATVMAEGALTRGRYRVVRELGRGGAGTVFLARDVALDREVALKVYHRRGRVDRERWLHEARTPAVLEHPGVVRVLDVDEPLLAIAMEVTEGSVKEAVRGRVPLERVLGWARSLVDTVGWLHGRGLVHRDLKPSNMLLRRGRIVLTDFGLAAALGTNGAAGGGEGTSGYMPVEQRRGEPASAAMDVHALGVSIDEMLGACDPAELADADLAALRAVLGATRATAPTARPKLDDVRRVLASRT
ncbi:MAG: serine/threonine-protein kinase [Deltaproteobacteria bacterium]